MRNTGKTSFATAWAAVRQEVNASTAKATTGQSRQGRGDLLFEEFETPGFPNWNVAGQAFGNAPVHRLPPNQPLRDFLGQGIASSFGASNQMVGSLTSKKFKMPKLFVHVLMGGSREESKGEKARLRFTVVADGHKSLHLLPKGDAGLQWMTLRLTKRLVVRATLRLSTAARAATLWWIRLSCRTRRSPRCNLSLPVRKFCLWLHRKGFNHLKHWRRPIEALFVRALQPTSDSGTVLAMLSPTGRLEDLAGSQAAASNQALSRPGNPWNAATAARVSGWLTEPTAAKPKASTTSLLRKTPRSELELRRLQAEREQLERRIPGLSLE